MVCLLLSPLWDKISRGGELGEGVNSAQGCVAVVEQGAACSQAGPEAVSPGRNRGCPSPLAPPFSLVMDKLSPVSKRPHDLLKHYQMGHYQIESLGFCI